MQMWRRFSALSVSDRRLVLEAAMMLTIAWASLRVASLAAVRRLADAYGSRHPAKRGDADAADRVPWAVRAVARRLPRATCLVQAVAGDAMLRRRGHRSELRVGVRTLRPFLAHAWVECDGVVVIGEVEDADPYGAVFAPAQP